MNKMIYEKQHVRVLSLSAGKGGDPAAEQLARYAVIPKKRIKKEG